MATHKALGVFNAPQPSRQAHHQQRSHYGTIQGRKGGRCLALGLGSDNGGCRGGGCCDRGRGRRKPASCFPLPHFVFVCESGCTFGHGPRWGGRPSSTVPVDSSPCLSRRRCLHHAFACFCLCRSSGGELRAAFRGRTSFLGPQQVRVQRLTCVFFFFGLVLFLFFVLPPCPPRRCLHPG